MFGKSQVAADERGYKAKGKGQNGRAGEVGGGEIKDTHRGETLVSNGYKGNDQRLTWHPNTLESYDFGGSGNASFRVAIGFTPSLGSLATRGTRFEFLIRRK